MLENVNCWIIFTIERFISDKAKPFAKKVAFGERGD